MFKQFSFSAFISFLILLVFALSVMADEETKKDSSVPFPGGKPAEIWMISGQSNAGGYGILKAPIEPDSRIMRLNDKNEWQIADEPFFKGFTRKDFQIAPAVRDNIL